MSGVLLFLLLVAASVALVVWQRRTHALDDQLDLLRDVLGRIYPSRPLSPRTLPRRLLRAASQTVTVGVSGSILLPTRIEISVNPADLEPLEGAIDWLSRDVAEALRQRAATEGWIVPDGPQIVIEPDPERPLRSPRAVGRIGALNSEDVLTPKRPAPVPAPGADDRPTSVLPVTAATAAIAAAPAVRLRLVATDGTGGNLIAVVTAGQEPLVLGRSREVQLPVDDRQASGRHCGFTLDPVDRELQVEDLGSTNGTFVDGRRVKHSALPPGTTLRVGASTWRVEVDPV